MHLLDIIKIKIVKINNKNEKWSRSSSSVRRNLDVVLSLKQLIGTAHLFLFLITFIGCLNYNFAFNRLSGLGREVE